MCTTNQIVFRCSHQATNRYRTNVCRTARHGRCKVRDETEILPELCRNCDQDSGQKRSRPSALHNEVSHLPDPPPYRYPRATWHVPSRCFVRVHGFRTLDPFGVGGDPENEVETVVRSRQAEILLFGTHVELVAGKSPAQTAQRGNWRWARDNEEVRLSPCCMKETRKGPYQSTRLEDRRDRINGMIVDSFCESTE